MPIQRLRLLAASFLFVVAGCDNVGRVWDPDVTPPADPVPTASAVQIVPVGGNVVDARPKVRAVYPKDGGWPVTVPIVVEFSESVNRASILPTTTGGGDGRIVLRVKGTTQVLPCQYDLLAGGRLLVMRPATPLLNQGNPAPPTYEVVLLQNARDVDGVRFEVPEDGTVLTEFQANQDESFVDGRILAVYPRDNARDVARESSYFIVFDRPANASTLIAANLTVGPDGGTPIAGDIALALQPLLEPDTRAVVFKPIQSLAESTDYEVVVTEDITFGASGQLDFNGRTPFARFETVAPAAPTAVALGNPTPGFPDKINRVNAANVQVSVTPPADARPGDKVRVRIYGTDAKTTAVGDVVFVERTTELTQPGAVAVSLDFTGLLGTLASPQFDDGSITFATQMQRGSETSTFIHQPSTVDLRFDVTQPTLANAGPPANGIDLWAETDFVAFHGVASEELAAAEFTDGITQATMYAADETGRFVMTPVPVGRLTAPRGYSLNLTDSAGNVSAGAVAGNLVQRGLVTGAFAGTLTIEAYDDATLAPIAGATVLIEPGTPVIPAVGQQLGTTDNVGRVTFPGLGAGPWTITVVRAGYDLVTLYRSNAAFASLPLRPLANATATLQGTVTLETTNPPPPPGTTVVVGNTAFADHSPLGVKTSGAAPTTIPDRAIKPNRMQVVTAFSGLLEPTVAPTYSGQAYQMLGATLTTPAVPGAPAAPGTVSRQDLTLLPSVGAITQPSGPFQKDFALAVGLDTANLDGPPITRVTASLNGFDGQAMFGVGFATLTTGAVWQIDANYGLPAIAGFAPFGPVWWIVTEARDTNGNTSRHRAFLDVLNPIPNTIAEAPSIPTVTSAGGTGSPLINVTDVLDENIFGAGLTEAVVDLVATDVDQRRWLVIISDRDAVGGTDAIQLPDLASRNVAGLRTGAWTVRAEARLWLTATLSTADDWMLTERTRAEVLYSRCAPITIAVN